MGMAHFTSGKRGYVMYTNADGHLPIPIENSILYRILTLEDTYRASEEYQDMYSQKDDLSWFRDVTLALQQRALREAGFGVEWGIGVSEKAGLMSLWSARGALAGNPLYNQLTVYQRKDRSREGSLRNGDLAPAVTLYTQNHEPVDFLDYMSQFGDKPVFIIAGSVS
eukprot:TRINITY_DN1716_c0_g1_i1.p1 TRINITY_DN1716_c0_g1~~TRINITY_DN1716_c0_g1_i1.p1  ORF type:complete len:167 (-),score=20.11 TRINITY_DN1716_c0_g1_i1:657-1157(-)